MLRSKVAALSLLATITLAACGGGSSTSGTVPANADVTVRAVDGIAWDAKEYSATSHDGKVILYGVNNSGIAHNLHVRDEAGNELIKPINLSSSGASGTVTFEATPGEYRIVCTIPGHESLMNSTLTVTAGAATDTTAAADTTAAP